MNNRFTHTLLTALAVNDTIILAGTKDGSVFLSTNKAIIWSAINSSLIL